MTKKYYVVPIFGSVEPQILQGPYARPEAMIEAARVVHAEQSQNDSIFWLEIDDKGTPTMGTFTTAELEPEEIGA
jgi:hypothetical protein